MIAICQLIMTLLDLISGQRRLLLHQRLEPAFQLFTPLPSG